MNYAEDLKINPDQLDVEWLEQSLRFHTYSSKSAEANRIVRKCDELVKVIRSELILEASAKGESVLGEGVKPTAPNIEAYYRNHAEYKKAKTALHDAQYQQEMLTNAVFAFHQRKSALENLTRLHGQNYFASPTLPRDLSEEYKEKQKEKIQAQKRERIKNVIKQPRRNTSEEYKEKQKERTQAQKRNTYNIIDVVPGKDDELPLVVSNTPIRRTRRRKQPSKGE